MAFALWGALVEELKAGNEKGPAVAAFRAYRDTLLFKFTSHLSFLRTFNQFRCIQDARLSLSVSHLEIPGQTEEKTQCLFSGAAEGLYYIQFISLVERAQTLIGTHPNISQSPFYCVSRPFLFYLYSIHLVSRAESLLYSTTSKASAIAVIKKLLGSIHFLARFCVVYGGHRAQGVPSASSSSAL
jgi:hypothetical protein